MKLKILGTNRTQITLDNGNVQFWSYETLVCVIIGCILYETEKFYSRTTNKMIGEFKKLYPGCEVLKVPQETLENDTFTFKT